MRPDFFRTTPFATAFEAAKLVAIDIGARGGFDPDLLPIAWAVDGIGFEPEPEAFAELAPGRSAPWRSLRWLPVAVGAATGRALLHVPTDPAAASLLPHDPAIGRRFAMEHLTDRRATVEVETVTLDEAMERWNLPAPAYLKLDVEGLEQAILEGAGRCLATALAVKAEATFLPVRVGQPLAGDLERFLRERGFVLMDILTPARWRTGPRPPHPYVARADLAYSRGQIAQCDLLAFRCPDSISAADGETSARAGLVALSLGFFDHAQHLFQRPAAAAWLREHGGVDGCGALGPVSRRYGRRAAGAAVRQRVRDLVPLARSLLFGLPG